MSEDTEIVTEQVVPDCGQDLRQLEVPLTLRIRVSPHLIIKGMGDSAPRDAYDLILGLEQEVGWWALTILLGRYFTGQMEVAMRHVPDMIAKTDEELLKELEEGE